MKHNNTRVALAFAMGLSALHSFPLMALLSFAATPAFAAWTVDESAGTISDGTFTISFYWKDKSSTPRTICLRDIKTYPASPATLDLRTVEGVEGFCQGESRCRAYAAPRRQFLARHMEERRRQRHAMRQGSLV